MKASLILAVSLFLSGVANSQNLKYKFETCQYMYNVFPQIAGYENVENVQINFVKNGQVYSYGQQNYKEEKSFYVFNQNPSEPTFKTVTSNPQLIFELEEKAVKTEKKVKKDYNSELKAYRYVYEISTERTYEIVIKDPAKNMESVLSYSIDTHGETQWPSGIIASVGFAKEADLASSYKTNAAKTPDFETAFEKQLLISCMNLNLCKSMVHSVTQVTERLTFTYKSIKSKDAKYAELASAYEHMDVGFAKLKENSNAKLIPCTFQKNVVDEMKMAHQILLKYYNQIDINKADKTDEEKDYEFDLSIGLYITSFITGDYQLCETLHERAKKAVAIQPEPKLNPLLGIVEMSFTTASRAVQEMNIYSYYMLREKAYGSEFKQRYNY